MDKKLFWKDKKVLLTGGAGFIGSAVVKHLVEQCGIDRERIVVPRLKNCDLRLLENCRKAVEGCQIVVHLAAVTGGIGFSRKYPAQQYFDSSMIDLNMAEAACRAGVEKFVAIGNLFAYASDAKMPLREEDLFNGLPTDAHRGVGWLKRNLALLADLYYRQYGMQMVVVYSANAYGPNDSLDPTHAHVIPSTIMKCYREKELVVWGDGTPTRDFLFVDDIAEGLILAAERVKAPSYINLGSGKEISVRELIALIGLCTDFKGKITYDKSKSGGDTRRVASVEKASNVLGFTPQMSIEQGMRITVDWYRSQMK